MCLQRERLSVTQWWSLTPYRDTCSMARCRNIDCNILIRGRATLAKPFTAIELSPEGTGYRTKTRFAKFYNLPELMSMFKNIADIQTADMIKLPVPKANYHNIALKPSEIQKEMVQELGERAEKVRNKMVDSNIDNMLLITNDGRKLALDQRLINSMLGDSETSKAAACTENLFEIWKKTAGKIVLRK